VNGYDFDKYTSPPKRPSQNRIRCYHVSYRRNTAANCNLRKNPGLNLLKTSDIDTVLPAGKTFRIVLAKCGPNIRLAVDGKVFMQYTDGGEVNGGTYAGGRFGLRQVYDSEGRYDNFRMYGLEAGNSAAAFKGDLDTGGR